MKTPTTAPQWLLSLYTKVGIEVKQTVTLKA
jgi:hypothetical protein